MYKFLTLTILVLVLAVGCSHKTHPPINDEDESVESKVVDLPDPGRSPGGEPVFGVEIPPEPIHQKAPTYPRMARDLGISGCTKIQAFVDENGRVKKAKAVSCDRPGFGFEQAALDAAYKYRYKPATQNGLTIGVWITYEVRFKLH